MDRRDLEFLVVDLMSDQIIELEIPMFKGSTKEAMERQGKTVPTKYSEVVEHWMEFMMDPSSEDFFRMMSNDALEKAYDRGEKYFRFECKTTPIREKTMCCTYSVIILKNESTGHLIATIVVQDITRQKRREEKALLLQREQESLKSMLFSAIEDSYVESFKINLDTKEGQRLVIGEHEVVPKMIHGNLMEENRRLCSSIHPEDKDAAKKLSYAYISKMKPGDRFQVRYRSLLDVENQTLRTDGKYSWYSTRIRCSMENGQRCVIIFTSDETEIIEKEMENQAQLEQALQAANSANRAKSTFLFNMSHDIRTPMNAILGFAELAKMHMSDEARVRDCLDKIQGSGGYLLRLINDVLSMSRIESGKVNIIKSGMSIGHMVENLSAMMKEEMQRKGVSYSVDIDVQQDYVLGDELHLSEVLVNLLGNAFKYTNPGGMVKFAIKQDGTQYVFDVVDTGIGMKQEYLEHIFEAFSRENTTTVSRIEGTGLGLAITKNIVEKMGGTISVESEKDVGSKFSVTLTLEPQKRESRAEAEHLGWQEFSDKRILVVEDNALNREIEVEILQETGFLVDEACDGQEAVVKVTTAPPGYYDLVLMDIQMPIMNGYEATRSIRGSKLAHVRNIPIIAVSANAFEEDIAKTVALGMNAHVAKPLKIDELINTINRMFVGECLHQVGNEKLVDWEISYKELGIKGGFLVYEADEDEKILYANGELLEIFGYRHMDEFMMAVGNSFKGMVHPDDYERVEKQIWAQIDKNDDDYDYVSYRIKRKDGSIRFLQDIGHLVDHPEYGKMFYVCVADVTDQEKGN